MNECQQLKKSNFIYALKASATSTCWLLTFWNFSKWFSHQTQIIQNASLHNMTVHRYSWKLLYIAPFLKHSNRRSYRIHAYLPKIYRKIINITKFDFSSSFKNFQTKFSNSTVLKNPDPNPFPSRNLITVPKTYIPRISININLIMIITCLV